MIMFGVARKDQRGRLATVIVQLLPEGKTEHEKTIPKQKNISPKLFFGKSLAQDAPTEILRNQNKFRK